MGTQGHFAAIVAGTTSIISLQLFGVLTSVPTNSYGHSRDLGVLTSIFANLPASAASNSATAVLGEQDFRISQATRSRIRFVPPADKNPRQSQGSGSRGCDNESLRENLVTLLIPSKEDVGQTISGRPKIFWHLSQSVPVPMQFTLVEDKTGGGGETVLEKKIDSPQAGIIQVEIPKDRPELVPGRIYRWNVSLVCNPKRPSKNIYLQSWIKRVATTPALEQQLATAQTLRERASIYAQMGLWYDAIATLSTALKDNPNDSSVQEDFLSLLDQVGLTNVAKQERQRFAKK